MTSIQFENMLDFERICNNIKQLDKCIELVTVLNNRGRDIELISTEEGINKDLTEHKREMLFMESVLKSSMNKEYCQEFGEVHCSILVREKFTLFSFEIFNYVLLVISRTSLNPLELKNKISEILVDLRKVELVH